MGGPPLKKSSGTGLGRASSVGIEMALAVVIGLVGGWWLDGELGTEPWLALVGLIIGTVAGFRSLLSALKYTETNDDEER